MSVSYPGFKNTKTTVEDHSIWVRTNYMDLANPNPAEIHLSDIARGLSRECRFAGQVREFYSVAEHSVNCVRLFQKHAAGCIFSDPWLRDIARDILMHDAHEAYLKDIPTPLKRLISECYNPIAERMQGAISVRFDLAEAAPEWVKRIDLEMLFLEKESLFPESGSWPIFEGINPPAVPLNFLPPHLAESAFKKLALKLELIEGAACL